MKFSAKNLTRLRTRKYRKDIIFCTDCLKYCGTLRDVDKKFTFVMDADLYYYPLCMSCYKKFREKMMQK